MPSFSGYDEHNMCMAFAIGNGSALIYSKYPVPWHNVSPLELEKSDGSYFMRK